MRLLLWVAAVSMAIPLPAAAQNSVYGIRGAGFPGRAIGVRARAMGGGIAMFDRQSAVNPAAVARLTNLRVSAMYGATFRNYDAGSSSVTGLRESRFPQAILGGALGFSRFSFAVGYATYAERSFDVTLADTINVGGTGVGVTDRMTSTGGIVDVRAAFGWRVSPQVQTGAGFHVINGSSKVSATRNFEGGGFREYVEATELSFSGFGVSGGVLWDLADPRMTVGFVGRWNSELTNRVDDRSGPGIDLPIMVGGGVLMQVTPRLQWATSASWRSWGGAVSQPGTFSFNTWDVSTGVEIGSGLGTLPLRVGGRYGTLPFGPVATQPYEYGVSLGSGFIFAQGRGELDFALERISRRGGGASERVWHFTMGVTVQP